MLVVGGSLGARTINEAIANGLDQLLQNGLQLIWQTGKTDSVKWQEAAKEKPSVWVNDFITEMEKGYAASDIVVSRAGAMAKAELCVVKKPVLFVPYPFAAEDHQTVNAQQLVKKEAALLIKDSEALEKLVPALLGLARDQQRQALMKENLKPLTITDADERVARNILEMLKQKP